MLFNPLNKLDILLQLVSWILMILWINMLKLGTSLVLVQAKADSILQITNKRTTQRFPNHMYIFCCPKNMFEFFSIDIFNVYVYQFHCLSTRFLWLLYLIHCSWILICDLTSYPAQGNFSGHITKGTAHI